MVEAQLVPRLRALPLWKLTTAHLNILYGELAAHGRQSNGGPLAPRTVRLCHTIIRKALADAVRWGLLTRNVAINADPPSAALARADAARRRRPWSVEDLQMFLRHVAPHRLYAAFLLAATTGMRRGELLGLRWCDLDLPNRRLSIVQTLIAPRYQMQLSTPKTDSGTRAIALDAGTAAALEHHRDAPAGRTVTPRHRLDRGRARLHDRGRPAAEAAPVQPGVPEAGEDTRAYRSSASTT